METGDSMHKFLIVFKHEYAQVVKKKSFLIGLIITPLFMGLMMFGPAMLAKTKSSSTEHLAVIDQSELGIANEFKESIEQYKLEDSTTPYYNIDEIFKISENDSGYFNFVNDSLKKLILEKDIKYLLVITPTALTTNTGVYITSSADNIVTYSRFRRQLSRIISSKRLKNSEINMPVDSVLNMTQRIDLITKDLKGATVSLQTKFFIAIIFVMMMYMLILINGQMVMRSVIDEKNSRIMEVLVSSVSPFQLMMGKIFGLGAATFTQVAIWILAGLAFATFGSAAGGNETLQNIIFNPFLLIYFVIFFILGFLLYSTLFALLGSVVSNEKEAQNFLFPIVICLILPIVMGMYIIQDPNSLVARILSFIPLFTPTMMVLRLNIIIPSLMDNSFFQVAFMEANLAIIVLAVSVIGVIWLTAKIFRIGILMHGKRITLPEIIKWVKY